MKLVKRMISVLVIGAFLLIGSVFGQEKNVLEEQKKEMNLADFSAIKISGLAKVHIEKGEKTKASLTVSGVDISEIAVQVNSEGTLVINTPGNISGESIEVNVTYKDLKFIAVDGAAELFCKGTIETSSLSVTLEEVSNAVLDVNVDNLDIKMKDNADLTIKGTARVQKIHSEGKNGTLTNDELKIGDK